MSKSVRNQLLITGARGIPANYGGFETFTEKLALFLVEKKWDVTVYCQEVGSGKCWESTWRGVKRVHIPVRGEGPVSTIIFDLKTIIHCLSQPGVVLTLGYNTAIFNVILRLKGRITLLNMDGLEWRRQKWNRLQKFWLWVNERIGCWCGSHLIADNPHIKTHLATRISPEKITMIPYGAEFVEGGDKSILTKFGLEENKYVLVIARPEPENSVLEIVNAFVAQNSNLKLMVLGAYDFNHNPYHQRIRKAASDNVVFAGTIFDTSLVSTLRFYARCYVHGHQVGGTNPSLVESIGAGNAILARDNHFNRWVAQDAAIYFGSEREAEEKLRMLIDDDQLIKDLRGKARARFHENLRWPMILTHYQGLLSVWSKQENGYIADCHQNSQP